MKNSPIKFVIELLVPVALIIAYFLIADPYKIIWHYDVFFPEVGSSKVGLDHDYVSVCTYDNYNDSLHYDSFILGNSRSRYYLVEDWKKYIGDSSVCYHMDASNETLEGVWLKLKYVSQRSRIKNCLLILDPYILAEAHVNKSSLIFFPAPQTTPEKDWFQFWASGFKSFVNPKFLASYTYLLLFGKESSLAKKDGVFDLTTRHYDYRWNETTWPEKEMAISNGTYYQGKIMDYFSKRYSIIEEEDSTIYGEQALLLDRIHSLLVKSDASFRIIISPTYDKRKFNRDDYERLCQIFGNCNVFDFSGDNWITDDYHNFYDISHYRPTIADTLMSIAYNKQ